MIDTGRLWTPYRLGVVAAVIGQASAVALFIALMMITAYGARVPVWALLIPLWAGAGAVFFASGSPWHNVNVNRCPECGKSLFFNYGWTSENGRRYGALLWWPEKQCSQCCYDLTEEQWT